MKTVVGCLLIVGILLSYVPVFPMDGCPGEGHTGIAKMDCGSLFHCPVIVDQIFSETSALPLRGSLVPTKLSLTVDELPNSVFHPPRISDPIFLSPGEGAANEMQAWDFGTGIAVLTL